MDTNIIRDQQHDGNIQQTNTQCWAQTQWFERPTGEGFFYTVFFLLLLCIFFPGFTYKFYTLEIDGALQKM